MKGREPTQFTLNKKRGFNLTYEIARTQGRNSNVAPGRAETKMASQTFWCFMSVHFFLSADISLLFTGQPQ